MPVWRRKVQEMVVDVRGGIGAGLMRGMAQNEERLLDFDMTGH